MRHLTAAVFVLRDERVVNISTRPALESLFERLHECNEVDKQNTHVCTDKTADISSSLFASRIYLTVLATFVNFALRMPARNSRVFSNLFQVNDFISPQRLFKVSILS